MSRLSLFVLFVVPALAASRFADAEAKVPGCYSPPVDAQVTDPFRLPLCEFCAGNRGLEYGTAPGQSVVSASAGVVTFSGVVAKTWYVVVTQDDGLRATYGRLLTAEVSIGERVRAGSAVGTSSERFFFGLRTPDAGWSASYLDPAPLLGHWRRASRLVPLDASPRRPGRTPHLVCLNARTDR